MGHIVTTNEGPTLVKEIECQHPADKMRVEVAKTQDDEVGDGTTTAVVLAGELLGGAESVIYKEAHSNIDIDGYRDAADKSQEILEKIARSIKPDDRKMLEQIALTSLNTKGIFGSQAHFANLAVDAVSQVMEKNNGKITADISLVKVMKKHGKSMDETELVNGIVVDKEVSHVAMPKSESNPGIARLNAKLEIEKHKTEAKITINRPTA